MASTTAKAPVEARQCVKCWAGLVSPKCTPCKKGGQLPCSQDNGVLWARFGLEVSKVIFSALEQRGSKWLHESLGRGFIIS